MGPLTPGHRQNLSPMSDMGVNRHMESGRCKTQDKGISVAGTVTDLLGQSLLPGMWAQGGPKIQNKRCSSCCRDPSFRWGGATVWAHPRKTQAGQSHLALLTSLTTQLRPGLWVPGSGTEWVWLREQGRTRNRGAGPGSRPGLQPVCPAAASPAAPLWPGGCSVWPGGEGERLGLAWTTSALHPLGHDPHL